MEFYEAKDDMKLHGFWLLGELQTPDGQEAERWVFGRGNPADWNDPLSVKVISPGSARDLTFNTFFTLIVSANAREILNEWAPGAAQFFPVDIAGARQKFFIANIVDQVDCLDEKL
jgi:hypothetical protein